MYRRNTIVAAVVVALLAAGAWIAIPAAPANNAADPPGSGHRFVFEEGKARYEGEAKRSTSLVHHITEARAHGNNPRQALEGLILDSLAGAGVPDDIVDALERTVGEDPKVGPWLLPAGDFDGDGSPDFLGQTVRWVGDGPEQLQIAGVRGKDGGALWERTLTATAVAAVPATVNGAAGALVFAYDIDAVGQGALVAGAEVAEVTLTVTALDAAGQTVSSRSASGSYRYASFIGGDVYHAAQLPFLVGVLDGDDDADTDVAVGRESFVATCAAIECAVAQAVTEVGVDDADAISVEGPYAVPIAYVGPDLFGIGRDTVVFATYDRGLRVDAADPGTGVVVWTRANLPGSSDAGPIDVGPVTGGPGRDIVMWSPYFGGESTLLRGGDGELQWFRHIGFPVGLAAAGPTGAPAVLGVDVFDDPYDGVVVQYTAMGDGPEPVYQRRYSVQGDPWSAVVDVFPDLGDLNGDGVADAGHYLLAADFGTESFNRDGGAVSGRTGEKLWSGKPGFALGNGDLASVDFNNRSLKVSRVNGATGAPRWSHTTPGDTYYSVEAQDVTGDGTADVLINAGKYLDGYDYESWYSIDGEPVLVDGATGRLLWALSDLPVTSRPRTEAKPYATPVTYWNTGPLPNGLVNDCRSDGQSVGGTCFQLDGTERTASFSIEDDVSGTVYGAYQFTDDALLPNEFSWSEFCGAVSDVPVPPGADIAWIFVYHADTTSQYCPDGEPATKGTITAAFS